MSQFHPQLSHLHMEHQNLHNESKRLTSLLKCQNKVKKKKKSNGTNSSNFINNS